LAAPVYAVDPKTIKDRVKNTKILDAAFSICMAGALIKPKENIFDGPFLAPLIYREIRAAKNSERISYTAYYLESTLS
jgi:hypothetical protein